MLIFVFLFSISSSVLAQTQEEQDAQLRAELAELMAEIARDQAILDNTKANTKSLKEEAALLGAKIAQAKALIKKKNAAIAKL